MPDIDTLIPDIYNLFGTGDRFDPALFSRFGGNLAELMAMRFNEDRVQGILRLSNVGKPDRQIWYEINEPGQGEPLTPQTHIKFMYGDMQEQLCILMAKMAGHTVEYEQETVEVSGIPGHIDCMIDGHVVDVKSASRYAFPKFKDGTLLDPGKDAFGYVGQLAAYVHAKTPGKDGYFLAVNKDLGHLALLKVPAERLAEYDIEARIGHVSEMVKGPIPPRCYPDEPEGKSGNRSLSVGCSYCNRKFDCWPGLKAYAYSGGPKFLTTVVKEPRVSEFADLDA